MTLEEEIKRAIDEFINAYNSGDIHAMLACYGDDLVKLRQGAPPETKPEVARRVAEVFNKFHSRVESYAERSGVQTGRPEHSLANPNWGSSCD